MLSLVKSLYFCHYLSKFEKYKQLLRVKSINFVNIINLFRTTWYAYNSKLLQESNDKYNDCLDNSIVHIVYDSLPKLDIYTKLQLLIKLNSFDSGIRLQKSNQSRVNKIFLLGRIEFLLLLYSSTTDSNRFQTLR